MTVTWHVDDLKISHKDKKEVSKFIIALSRIYGDKISVHRGKFMITSGWTSIFPPRGGYG